MADLTNDRYKKSSRKKLWVERRLDKEVKVQKPNVWVLMYVPALSQIHDTFVAPLETNLKAPRTEENAVLPDPVP